MKRINIIVFSVFLSYFVMSMNTFAKHHQIQIKEIELKIKKSARSRSLNVNYYYAFYGNNRINIRTLINCPNVQIQIQRKNGFIIYDEICSFTIVREKEITIPNVSGDYLLILKDGKNEYTGMFTLSGIEVK